MSGRRRLLVPADLVPVKIGQKRKTEEPTENGGLGLSSKSARLLPHSEAEEDRVGIIEKVCLEGFMCHDRLEWQPNSRVNFVTGQNGAGKSSVLQGIVLGLLGETKNIKRFNKVSEFIKKGSSKAVIQVTLSNVGEDAYKPEIFGKSITFQRTINESGSSAYLLKGENLEDVARKSKTAKDECKRILEKFQIQLDSPIVVLHQDEAKEMLKMESPDKLYHFFEKSTLIKQCFDQYSQAQVEYNRAKTTLREKARALKDLGQEYRKQQAKYDEIQRSEQMDQELMETKGEYAWARVHAARETAENITSDMNKVDEKITQLKSKLMSFHEKLADLKIQKTELQIQLEEDSGTFTQQEEEIARIKEKLERTKLELKQMNANLRMETQNKNKLSQEVRILREQLEEVERKEGEEFSRQEKRKLERKVILKKLESDKRGAEAEINQTGKARERIEEKLKVEEGTESQLRKELSGKRDRQKILKAELDDLQRTQGAQQRLAVFGAKIPALELELERSRAVFKVMPVGPVGAHVKLTGEAATNPEVGRLLETELTRAGLTAYLCDSDHDRRELSAILNRVYGGDKTKPRIFTSKFLNTRHNVTRPFISGNNVVLLMDLLHIDNPVVSRFVQSWFVNHQLKYFRFSIIW